MYVSFPVNRLLTLKTIIYILFFIFSPDIDSEDIIKKALDKKIYDQIQWKRMLHYAESRREEKNKSRIIHGKNQHNFFMAHNGMENSMDELISDIREFLHSNNIGDEHPACKFPARYKWLRKELGSKVFNYNFVNCKGLNKFRKELSAKTVSMVFVSGMTLVPSSMFGHIFIKLNKDLPSGNVMDDYTFSFSANVNSSNFIEYAIRGITGGFEGIIDFRKFENRIWYYNYVENRNMWEFRLKFSEEEVERLVDHLWELRYAYLKYYFISQNCAYYNSYFFEIIKPELSITKDSDIASYPTEVIKNLLENPNVLEKALFYPANILNFESGYNQLSKTEINFLNELGKSKSEIPITEKQETLLNTIRFKEYVDAYDEKLHITQDRLKAINEIEKKMTNLNIPVVQLATPDLTNPTGAHHPFMFSVLYGYSNYNYLEYTIRPLYHEKIDLPIGFPPFSEIVAFKIAFKLNLDEKLFYLNRIDFFSLLSIAPLSVTKFNLSMKLSIWMKLPEKTDPGIVNPKSYIFNFDNGYGIGMKIPFIKNDFLWYLFANAALGLSDGISKYYWFLPYGEFGLFWYPVDVTTLYMNLKCGYYLPYNKVFLKSEISFNFSFYTNISLNTAFHYDFIFREPGYQVEFRNYF